MSSLLADEGDISWEAASTLWELWLQFWRHHRAKTVPKSAFVDMATSHLRRIAAAFSQSPGAAKLPSKARVMAILQDTCMTAIISALTHAHAAGVNEQNVASKIYRLMGVNSGSFSSTFETKIFPSVPNQGGAYGGKTGAVDDVFLSGKTYVATVYRERAGLRYLGALTTGQRNSLRKLALPDITGSDSLKWTQVQEMFKMISSSSQARIERAVQVRKVFLGWWSTPHASAHKEKLSGGFANIDAFSTFVSDIADEASIVAYFAPGDTNYDYDDIIYLLRRGIFFMLIGQATFS